MKILGRLSSIFGDSGKQKSEPENSFLDPFEIRLLREGRLEKLAEFAESPRLHFADPKGDTPLHLAAQTGNLALCDLFIRYGADPSALNHKHETPAAVAHAAGKKLVSQLLSSLIFRAQDAGGPKIGEKIPTPDINIGTIQDTPVPFTAEITEGESDELAPIGLTNSIAGTIWTNDRAKLLRDMWRQGLSVKQIADELGGVSNDFVLIKVNRLGLGESDRITSNNADVQHEPSSGIASLRLTKHGQKSEPVITHSALAPTLLDGLDELLNFKAEEEPQNFFSKSSHEDVSGEFTPLINPTSMISNVIEEDWEFNLESVSIKGEGIGTGAVSINNDVQINFLKPSRGKTVKCDFVQTSTRMSVDKIACTDWVNEILIKGSCSLGDIESLTSHCHGNWGLEELRINLLRLMEIAGFEISLQNSEIDLINLAPKSNTTPEVLAEAIEAALCRSTRLPGMQRYGMTKSDEKILLKHMVRARQELHLGILSSKAAVRKLLDDFDGILVGNVDPNPISLKAIIPSRPGYAETAEIIDALEILKLWQINGSQLDGKQRRQALTALEELDLSMAFHNELACSIGDDPESLKHAATLKEQISVFDHANKSLINEHIPHVRRFSALNILQGEDPEDVFQVAFIGMQRATRRFDSERGARFGTYATFWMRQSITRWRADEGTTIRIPVHRVHPIAELDRAVDRLNRMGVGAVTDSDLADDLKWTNDEVLWFRTLPRTAVYPDSSDHWDRLLPEQEEICEFDQAETAEIIAEALEDLPERQAEIICMRFGIGRDRADGMTLEEIGQLQGVTRERIRQIERKGLQLLAHPARKRRLQELLGR